MGSVRRCRFWEWNRKTELPNGSVDFSLRKNMAALAHKRRHTCPWVVSGIAAPVQWSEWSLQYHTQSVDRCGAAFRRKHPFKDICSCWLQSQNGWPSLFIGAQFTMMHLTKKKVKFKKKNFLFLSVIAEFWAVSRQYGVCDPRDISLDCWWNVFVWFVSVFFSVLAADRSRLWLCKNFYHANTSML